MGMSSGLERIQNMSILLAASRITGTVKVINDADNQTGAHGSALSIRTDEAIIIDGDGHVEIRTYNDNSYAHTNAVRLHNDGASLLIDKAGYNVTMAFESLAGKVLINMKHGIYVANNNQNVVINADNINFENNGYNRGYGIWTELQLQILR